MNDNLNTPNVQPQYEPPTIEEWRAVPGFDSYEVSDRGRVRSIDRQSSDGRNLKGCLMSPGYEQGKYLFVNLRQNGINYTIRVHSLVAWAFIGPQPQGIQVNHKDLDKTNNHYSNLEYVTRDFNNQHGAAKNASHFKKLIIYNAKLLLSSGEFNRAEILYLTQCGGTIYSSLRRGYSWLLPELEYPPHLGKITPKNRARIMALVADGNFTLQEIADRFEVDKSTISRIGLGKQYIKRETTHD